VYIADVCIAVLYIAYVCIADKHSYTSLWLIASKNHDMYEYLSYTMSHRMYILWPNVMMLKCMR
jgi:hypothetical protein